MQNVTSALLCFVMWNCPHVRWALVLPHYGGLRNYGKIKSTFSLCQGGILCTAVKTHHSADRLKQYVHCDNCWFPEDMKNALPGMSPTYNPHMILNDSIRLQSFESVMLDAQILFVSCFQVTSHRELASGPSSQDPLYTAILHQRAWVADPTSFPIPTSC